MLTSINNLIAVVGFLFIRVQVELPLKMPCLSSIGVNIHFINYTWYTAFYAPKSPTPKPQEKLKSKKKQTKNQTKKAQQTNNNNNKHSNKNPTTNKASNPPKNSNI